MKGQQEVTLQLILNQLTTSSYKTRLHCQKLLECSDYVNWAKHHTCNNF